MVKTLFIITAVFIAATVAVSAVVPCLRSSQISREEYQNMENIKNDK
jgi:hypothetical protein